MKTIEVPANWFGPDSLKTIVLSPAAFGATAG